MDPWLWMLLEVYLMGVVNSHVSYQMEMPYQKEVSL